MEDGTTPNFEIDIVKINDLYEGGAVYALAEEVPKLLKKLQQIFEQNQSMHHKLKCIKSMCQDQTDKDIDWKVDAVKRKILSVIDERID
jgi:hypothetical protein